MSKPLKPIIKQKNLNVRNLLKKAKSDKEVTPVATTLVKEVKTEGIYLGKCPLTGVKLFH